MSTVDIIFLNVIVAFLGFQIGSIVEYYKKYNFYDLEHDKVVDLVHALLAKVKGAL